MFKQNVRGVIFDMDGTLIDSEIYVEKVVIRLLHKYDISSNGLDCKPYHGIQWSSIASDLQTLYPQLPSIDIASWLREDFDRCMKEHEPPMIEGAKDALEVSRSLFSTALVTSSNKGSVDLFLSRFTTSFFDICISADDYQHSKPHPEGYLLAAKSLNISPSECIVFEDSLAGLTAARSAGMKTIAITCRSADPTKAREIADLAVDTFVDLPKDFFTACLKSNV